MRLKPEVGVTEISLANAKEIIVKYGVPDIVQLVNEGNSTGDHVVHASWGDGTDSGESFDHKFTGFSWGYSGEGPAGLTKFFEMVGISKRLESNVVAKLPSTTPGMILSLARNGWAIEFAHADAIATGHSSLQKIEGPSENPKLL